MELWHSPEGGGIRQRNMEMRKIIMAGMILVFLMFGMITGTKAETLKEFPPIFCIFSSRLDGKDLKLLFSSTYRQINHARISPDAKWITFSRFNTMGSDGIAMETDGYLNTEIMIAPFDATSMESIISPQASQVAVNSYFTPGSDGIIYIADYNSGISPQINRVDINTKAITRIPTPYGLLPSDPHQVGEWIVYPVISYSSTTPNCIWIMKEDGSAARQLTHPVFPESARNKILKHKIGDFDPKLSPDCTKVALGRQVSSENFHIIVIDVNTGEEKDLTGVDAQSIEVMPEWSSDGNLLVFWQTHPTDASRRGIYTITPEGLNRKKIVMPTGYIYGMPAFFPAEGSNDDAHIIYSAQYYNATSIPSAPRNLTAKIVSLNQIELNWIAPVNNTDIVGYKIYRDGRMIETLDSTVTSYTDRGVDLNINYSYSVSAINFPGNESPKTSSVVVSIDKIPPSAPKKIRIQKK